MPRFEFKPSNKFSSWLDVVARDKIFVYFIIAWLVPLVLSVIFVLLNYQKFPLEIPLFYSRTWGESQLAARQYIFLPIVGTLLLGIFNLGLAASLHQNDRIFSYLLAGTASLVSILGAITIFNIIGLLA